MLKVASVFSGIGSFEHSLVKSNIPHEILFACDIDKYCKKNYLANYNLPETRWYSDIKDVPNTDYYRKIELLMGSPPCQSFSIAGQRKGFADPRGSLVVSFIELVLNTQPKVFIFENVRGLTNHDKGKTFKWILEQFEDAGYALEWGIVSAKKLGFAQSRERVFVIGHRKDIQQVSVIKELRERPITKRVKDYLDLQIDPKYYITNHKWQKWVCDQKLLNKKKMCIVGENTEYIICQTARQYASWYGNFVLEISDLQFDWSAEAKATIKDLEIIPVGWADKFDYAKVIASTRLRRFTPQETLRLMGFDTDSFKTVCSDSQTYKQCGNSIVVTVFDEILKVLYRKEYT